MTATLTPPVKEQLPWPLVKVTRHPVRWVHNKVVTIAAGVTLAHVGLFIVAALYYLLTQKNPSVKHWWDTTVTPSSLRHDIRDVGEGTLAACLAGAIVWNHFKKSHKKAGRIFTVLNAKLHVPVVFAALLTAAVLWTVAFVAGEWIFHALAVHTPTHAITGSVWHRTVNSLWKSAWDKKVLGFVSTFFARRPLHIVYDEMQAYFASRRVAQGKRPRFYHPPAFKARVNYLAQNKVEVRHYSPLVNWIMGVGLLASIGLAGYGYYVLTYIK